MLPHILKILQQRGNESQEALSCPDRETSLNAEPSGYILALPKHFLKIFSYFFHNVRVVDQTSILKVKV